MPCHVEVCLVEACSRRVASRCVAPWHARLKPRACHLVTRLATRGVALAVLFPRHALLQLLLRWQAAQLLKKIHIMKAQQAENERVRADKEHQRQEAMREEKERVAQLKVRDRQGEGKEGRERKSKRVL
jgi:hypothetical protein